MALKKSDFVYFIFSKEQMEFKKDIAKRRGRSIVFGSVLVNGVMTNYTDIVTDVSKVRYSDMIILTSGLLGDIRYTEGSK